MVKIAVFDDYRVGLVDSAGIHDISGIVPGWRPGDPQEVNRFIAAYPEVHAGLDEIIERSPALPLDNVALRAPVPRPGQLLAAPLNFAAHREEMTGTLTAGPGTAAELGFFLKSQRSIADPGTEILLPDLAGRRFDFEAEVAVVVGRPARSISIEDALSYVFGYTLILDMTLRMTDVDREERTMRKSFATFTPMGPWIVTADEVPDPADLTLKAWQNGDLRQDASLADLIVSVPDLLARASRVAPLEPGDVYSTGSPAGVGQASVGDQLVVESPPIGRLEMTVASRTW